MCDCLSLYLNIERSLSLSLSLSFVEVAEESQVNWLNYIIKEMRSSWDQNIWCVWPSSWYNKQTRSKTKKKLEEDWNSKLSWELVIPFDGFLFSMWTWFLICCKLTTDLISTKKKLTKQKTAIFVCLFFNLSLWLDHEHESPCFRLSFFVHLVIYLLHSRFYF